MSFYYSIVDFNLSGKTLVIPVVSVANVGQLAVDLLIASLSLEQIGIFDSRYLIPVAGAREGGQPGVTTPLELYGREGVNIIVLQQRSPVLKLFKEQFVDSLYNFIQKSGVASTLFLSGVDMSNRIDSQMITPTYHIHPPNSPSLASSPLSMLPELPIPAYFSPVSQYPHTDAIRESTIPFIPGGGLTRRILSSLPDSWSIPTVCLLQYVMEGDNRGDAQLMAVVVAKLLKLDPLIHSWKQPSSWDQGLFGTPHDQTLYG